MTPLDAETVCAPAGRWHWRRGAPTVPEPSLLEFLRRPRGARALSTETLWTLLDHVRDMLFSHHLELTVPTGPGWEEAAADPARLGEQALAALAALEREADRRRV